MKTIKLQDINVYDILVFEDENGSIYQDCVCKIDNDILKRYNRRVINANRSYIILDKRNNKALSIYDTYKSDNMAGSFKLKEIGTITDEDIYKKFGVIKIC